MCVCVKSQIDCKLTATDIHTGCHENRPEAKRNIHYPVFRVFREQEEQTAL